MSDETTMLARIARLLRGDRTDRGDTLDDLDADRVETDDDADLIAEALRLRRGVEIDPYQHRDTETY